MSNPDADLTADIRAAIASTKDTGGESVSDSAEADVGVGAPGGVAETQAAPEAETRGVDGDAQGPLEGQTAAERARDIRGRFAPKAVQTKTSAPEVAAQSPTKAAPTQTAASPTGTVPPAAGGDSSTKPPPAELKAPQALTAQEREHFSRAPPEIQRALVRIDQTARQAMQESAPARRFAQEVGQVLAPIAQARGASPAQLIQSYVQADQLLSSPDPQTKAAAIARLMQTYGVPVEALDAVLSNPQAQQSAQPQPQQRQMDPEALLQQAEQRFERRLVQRQAVSEVDRFYADPANDMLHGDFGQKVWGKMVALVQSGDEPSLQAAYEEAVWAVPETRAILQQRQAAEAANAAQASTQRARAASVSVRSQPAPAPQGPAADDLDSTIRAAMTAARRR